MAQNGSRRRYVGYGLCDLRQYADTGFAHCLQSGRERQGQLNHELEHLFGRHKGTPPIPKVAPQTTTTTTTTTPTPTPTPTNPTPYFDRQGTEALLDQVATTYQGGSLIWRYSSSNADFEATTDDDFCEFSVVNSDGEPRSKADGITISCGLPLNVSSVTKQMGSEAAATSARCSRRMLGRPQVSWLHGEAERAANGAAFGAARIRFSFGTRQSAGNAQESITIDAGY